MKALTAALLGFGLLGVLFAVFLWVGILGATIYGLYLAFSASLLVGILALIIEPSPLIIGLVMLFFDKNLAQMLVDFLNK